MSTPDDEPKNLLLHYWSHYLLNRMAIAQKQNPPPSKAGAKETGKTKPEKERNDSL